MLELKNIDITLLRDGKKIIDNFTFALNRGDRAVVIGEEGNGKSTLIKLIYDPALIDNYCDYSGSVVKKGKPGFLPQAIDSRFLDMTVADYYEGVEARGAAELMTRLHLPLAFLSSRQSIGSLSGGERVKLQLARILMEQPDILLLDEPTNDIDLETLEWLEGFIVGSQLPILYVSHDEELIENTANIIIHIEQLEGKSKCRITTTRSSYGDYVKNRGLLFDKQMQVAKKQRSDYAAQMERWRRIYNSVNSDQRNIAKSDRDHAGQALKKKMKSVTSQNKRLEKQAEDFLEIPRVESAILTKFDSTITIPNRKTVLDLSLRELEAGKRVLSRQVELKVVGPEHIGIVGHNGAGKSTLLHEIWEQVRYRRDINAVYMPQNYEERLDYSKTPVEFLAENYSKDEVTRARTYMGSMRFTRMEMIGRIGSLSGGQRAKLLYLDMVLKGADLLILDEPTRNFSPLSCPVIRSELRAFGGAIISVSHDRKYLREVCDRVYELSETGLKETFRFRND